MQEYCARRELVAELKAEFFTNRAQECERKLDQYSAAIAGLAISSDRATMCQASERGDCRFDNLAGSQCGRS